ncbi:ASKHA domain-containing protein [Chloroflexota bacterium]
MKKKEAKNLKQKNRERSSELPTRKYRLGGVWLNVLPDDLWLRIPKGESVWEALQNTDVELESDCGGLGTCGKCKIKVLSEIEPPTIQERELLDEKELGQGIRLACRTGVFRDMVISTTEAGREEEYLKILTTSHHVAHRYLPTSELEPLIRKQHVVLPPDIQKDGLSDLDAIKLGLGSEYSDLKAPLGCLQTLPQKFKETQFRGTAVLHEHCLLEWQNQDKADSRYGLVFDLGTSTLVGKLFNLTDGSEIAVTSCLNSQTRHGSDVISRLKHIKEHQKGLENLRRLVINDLNQLTTRLLLNAGLHPEDIFITVAAGNTVMQHIFLGLSPAGIAEAPFSPVLTDGLIVKAVDAGLHLHPEALLYVMPIKSGYIGGDLLSFVMASGVAEQEDEIILGLDLGTNGEIFLGNSKRLLTCSAAAGPALEGARISQGMIAKAGAIEGVSFEEGDLHYLVIGNISPKGLCGSGLVELVAVLLELGVIDYEGLIRLPQEGAAKGLSPRLINRSGVYDFLIASTEESYDHKPLYLTQRDVRELQLAKGAIAAGVKTLTDEMDIGIEDIDRVYLAGAFGNYVNLYSAMRIGLIPRLDPEIISSLGNAASTGASMVLLSKDYWQMANKLTAFIEHIELSSRLDFNQYFIEQMDFSKENLLDVYREEVGEEDVMRTIKVEEVMTRDFPTVLSTMSVKEMSNMLRDTGHHGFPVLDETGYLFGVATLADLEASLRSGKADLTAGDIATREPFVAYPDQSLHEVLGATAEDYGRIPVVDRRDGNRLLGVLRRRDIMMAYRRRTSNNSRPW